MIVDVPLWLGIVILVGSVAFFFLLGQSNDRRKMNRSMYYDALHDFYRDRMREIAANPDDYRNWGFDPDAWRQHCYDKGMWTDRDDKASLISGPDLRGPGQGTYVP